MSYTRPTLAEIISRVVGDISSRTQGSAFLKRSVERVLAYVVGGVAHGLYGYLEWIYRQISPTTCGEEMLARWGTMVGVPRKGSSAATGSVTFSGTNGTVFPLGRQMQDASGATYTSTSTSTVAGGVVTITVQADATGSAGNLDMGALLALLTPVAGITSSGSVAAPGFAGGADVEDLEDWRARVLDELRTPSSGGGPGDYVKWAEEYPGVAAAWEFPNRMGFGTVSVGFVVDGTDIPSTGEVAAVQAYIDARRPVDMRAVYVVAPISQAVDFAIALRPNNPSVQAAVTTALQELFVDSAALEQSIALSSCDEAISLAPGELSHDITSHSSLTPGAWSILRLGTITFADLV